jgi:hypothetical protein
VGLRRDDGFKGNDAGKQRLAPGYFESEVTADARDVKIPRAGMTVLRVATLASRALNAAILKVK